MAYQKQTWQTGETITAQKLNHMEDGINQLNNNGWLIVNILKSYEQEITIFQFDKTINEIINAFPFVIVQQEQEDLEEGVWGKDLYHIGMLYLSHTDLVDEKEYVIKIYGSSFPQYSYEYTAKTLNDYPMRQTGEK